MKILVVDDHPLIQEALPRVLAKLHEDVEVVSAARFDEALAAARHGDINLILLDLGLPDTDGFAALAQLRQHHPTVPVVVLSATSHREVVLRALEEGAMGFVPKTSRTDILVEALRLVLAGGVYLPPEVVWHGQSISVGFKVALGGSPTPATKTPGELGLTERQVDVLSLLVQGLPNKVICRQLSLAEGTVKLHVTAILKALNARNRTQAVIAVAREGLQLHPLARPRARPQPPAA